MWPFKKADPTLHLDMKYFEDLTDCILKLGFKKASERQDIVGVVDLVTIVFEKGVEHVEVTADSYSGIDVSGSPNAITQIKSGGFG